MDAFYWNTEAHHSDNSATMQEYLDLHMDPEWKLLMQDGTMAEVQLPDGRTFDVHAGGNGDSYSHVITFVETTARESK